MKFNPIVFKEGAWSRHLPFAYELVREMRPRILVELGSHKGESYFGFCQSVKDHSLQTVCYAVDTWEGDSQAGFYGDEIFTRVNEINLANYAHFSYLVRSLFDDAAKQFSDHSIDLLHIDGLHTYEAVKNDFNTWIGKMSEKGIILFHDIMVRHGDFGVWKLWEELQRNYPTFTFKHGYGLGVLFVNSSEYQDMSFFKPLLAKDEAASIQIHEYYRERYEDLETQLEFMDLRKLRETQAKRIQDLELDMAQLRAHRDQILTRYGRFDRLATLIDRIKGK